MWLASNTIITIQDRDDKVERSALKRSDGATNRTYQNAKVQNVTVTARFCEGMPTREASANATSVPFTAAAGSPWSPAPRVRSRKLAKNTTQIIQPMLP